MLYSNPIYISNGVLNAVKAAKSSTWSNDFIRRPRQPTGRQFSLKRTLNDNVCFGSLDIRLRATSVRGTVIFIPRYLFRSRFAVPTGHCGGAARKRMLFVIISTPRTGSKENQFYKIFTKHIKELPWPWKLHSFLHQSCSMTFLCASSSLCLQQN